jgi:hypothetical protein
VTGEVLWSRLYQGTAGLDEAALAVASDEADDVYYTGRVLVAGQGVQMLTMKLDGDTGSTVWTDVRGGGGGGDDLAWDIVVGPDGNPVVSGHTIEAGAVARCLTRKLSGASGAMVWEAVASGAVNDIVTRSVWLAVAPGGDIIMAQRGYGATNGYDVLLARYGAVDGHVVWNVRYDGSTHGGDDPRAMILTAGGDVVVAGVQDVWWNYNYMTLKFAGASGALLWQAPAYDGPPGWYDVATAVAEGPGGQVVTTGLSDGTGTSWDIATVGYDGATGQKQWVLRYDGPASQSDEPRAVVVGGGRVNVCGYSYAAATGKDWVTLNYDLGLSTPAPQPLPTTALLAAPWPNPFNPATTVAFDLPAPADTRVTIHALDGTLVRTLCAGVAPAGRTTLAWDGRDRQGHLVAAGTYLVRLECGSTTESRPLTLLK